MDVSRATSSTCVRIVLALALAAAPQIVQGAPQHLLPGGLLGVEVGAGEAPAVKALFEERGFEDVRVTRDLARIERVVSGITRA